MASSGWVGGGGFCCWCGVDVPLVVIVVVLTVSERVEYGL